MKKSEKLLFVAGFLAVCMLFIPWIILGKGAIVTYHDQLDGEMIAYILQAKHLMDGTVLPEFMNGAPKTALTLPAPLSVLLFLGGNYEAALFIMQLLGSLVGYAGMYLLAREVTKRSLPAVIAGGLYGALPFLPVYGFSQYGLPLLLWCILQLRKGRRKKLSWGYGLIYALNSSLALIGFAVLAVYGVMIVCELIFALKKRETEESQHAEKLLESVAGKGLLRQIALWSVLFWGYTFTNLSLIKQILGVGEVVVSHKTEYVLAAEGFLNGWINGLFYGGQHSQDYHLSFLVAGAVVLIASKIKQRKPNPVSRTAVYTLLVNMGLAATAAVWNSEIGVALRGQLGALGAFQVDRLLWISPCLWYLFLSCCLALLLEMLPQKKGDTNSEKNTKSGLVSVIVCGGLMIAALGLTGLQILKNSDFKSNVQKLRNPEYPAMSYEDYYAIGVYEQVESFLAERTGLSQSGYRVVSLGIDPAAALYHGFYCLDGYSNNYSLDYKHAFRDIIAPALQESEYLRDYYDNWGNRCYVFGSECPGYYTIEKNGFYFSHLELDTEALRDLGGNYLFSAAYIANAEELGLVLLQEEAFETEESYYRIFVYEVEAP